MCLHCAAMATEHSQKCCETLVDAGAIDALLKQIRKANRSAPYQEVLKHAFSTLRNLIRYPHLAVILVNTNGSVETIFWELLRYAIYLCNLTYGICLMREWLKT